MRWDDFRRSDNVEDDRDGGGGFGGFGMPVGVGGLGIGTIVVLGLVGWALGIDPRVLIGGGELVGGREARYEQPQRPVRSGTPSDPMGQFVAAVLGDTEDRWTDIFRQDGQQYRAPKLRLFHAEVRSACGEAVSAMGPFYCPRDQHVYLDTSFFEDLQTRFRGCAAKACEFAQAYVIAHEVGHHVQNLLGILPRVESQKKAAEGKAEANRLQVKLELQADCFAGTSANHSEQKWKILEPGDVEAALRTAAAIGDDRLQQARGRVVPNSFTHGTSEQRQRWFAKGLKGGKVSDCNTFAAASL